MDNIVNVIIGDIHGRFSLMNRRIHELSKIYNSRIRLLCCGEFGYWPNDNFFINYKLPKCCDSIYFCDGNHEDHIGLRNLHSNNSIVVEVMNSIFHVKRGGIITLNDMNIMFIGGAESVDKSSRVPGVDWFPDEAITYSDIEFAINSASNYKNVDIVISHTCPSKFSENHPFLINDIYHTISMFALDEILSSIIPSRWIFSHFHKSFHGIYTHSNMNTTKWVCLNMLYGINDIELL